MKLYHGTSTRYLNDILLNGLLPRKITGNSNWGGDIESIESHVYLTTAYPVYFAWCALRENDTDDLLILECDVDKKRLYPDEDFLAWVLKGKDPLRFQNMHLNEITKYARSVIDENKEWWANSLSFNGVVSAKGGIPSKNITAYRTIPRKEVGLILAIGGDSMPIPINYKLCGLRYNMLMQTLFASENGLEEVRKAIAKESALWKARIRQPQPAN